MNRSFVRFSSQIKTHWCIPKTPVQVPVAKTKVQVEQETILSLERLSLVNFANVEGIQRLTEAIEFAEPLKQVDTTGVEPMFTVLDDETLRLAPDEIQGHDNVLKSAQLLEENYFVAPPGNIPLKQDPKRFLKTTN